MHDEAIESPCLTDGRNFGFVFFFFLNNFFFFFFFFFFLLFFFFFFFFFFFYNTSGWLTSTPFQDHKTIPIRLQEDHQPNNYILPTSHVHR